MREQGGDGGLADAALLVGENEGLHGASGMHARRIAAIAPQRSASRQRRRARFGRTGPMIEPARCDWVPVLSKSGRRQLQDLSLRISSASTQSARFRLTLRSMLRDLARADAPALRAATGLPAAHRVLLHALERRPEAVPEVLGPARLDQLLGGDRRRRLRLRLRSP